MGAGHAVLNFQRSFFHPRRVMEFGRLRLVGIRSLLAFALVLLCSAEFKAWAQQAPAASSAGNAAPGLPAARPISEAAVGSAGVNADSAKATQSGAPASSVAT